MIIFNLSTNDYKNYIMHTCSYSMAFPLKSNCPRLLELIAIYLLDASILNNLLSFQFFGMIRKRMQQKS